MQLIEFINVGQYVFESIGFCDEKLAGKYVFNIKGNFGELWKLQGTSGLIGKLIIDAYKRGNYQIEVIKDERNMLNLKEIADIVSLLTDNVWSNYKPKK